MCSLLPCVFDKMIVIFESVLTEQILSSKDLRVSMCCLLFHNPMSTSLAHRCGTVANSSATIALSCNGLCSTNIAYYFVPYGVTVSSDPADPNYGRNKGFKVTHVRHFRVDLLGTNLVLTVPSSVMDHQRFLRLLYTAIETMLLLLLKGKH